MFLRFNHFDRWSWKVHSYSMLFDHSLYKYSMLYGHLPILLWTFLNVAFGVHVQVSVICVSKSVIAGCRVCPYSTLQSNAKLFSKAIIPINIPTNTALCLISLKHLFKCFLAINFSSLAVFANLKNWVTFFWLARVLCIF